MRVNSYRNQSTNSYKVGPILEGLYHCREANRKSRKLFPFVRMDGWMDDLRFYIPFNSISVISGRCLDDNERLCAVELRLGLRRFHLE